MGTLPVTKTIRSDRVKENLAAPQVELVAEEVELLTAEREEQRLACVFACFAFHNRKSDATLFLVMR